MQKTCSQCAQPFDITDSDLEFYKKVSPVIKGKTYDIPPPSLCPACRQQRRISFRNERTLYNRTCNATGKPIISMYSPDSPYIIYDQEYWWGDQWDGLAYGRPFDFNKIFTEQFRELYLDVPHISLHTKNVENSYYTNFSLNQKNCYLIFGGGTNEDCMFSRFIHNCNDCVDSASLYGCQFCYEGIASDLCYGCRYFLNCRSCTDCLMIEECQGCTNCIACFGLRRKEFCVGNEFVGKEKFLEYKKRYEFLTATKVSELRQQLGKLKASLPHLLGHLYGSEDCSGDMVFNSKNCQYCFDVKDCENGKYLYFSPKGINSQDCTFNAPDGVQFCYNVCSTVGSQNSMCNFLFWFGYASFYCMECDSSKYCFGCVGLRRKEYCILNKQYTKAEYEELVPRIIEQMIKNQQWGEYFPSVISPFAYNETIAQEYFPLQKEQALALGYRWKDIMPVLGEMADRPRLQNMPDDIRDVSDTIINQTLPCAACAKPYRVVNQELKFYRRMGVPLPQKCWSCRYLDRFHLRNPQRLWKRNCGKCGKEIETNYASDRKEKVYCEQCYLQEVY